MLNNRINVQRFIDIDKIEKVDFDGYVYSLKIKNDSSYCLADRIITKNCDLPDIDMDFEDIKRDKVREHLQEMYGVDNVAGLSTFGTMRGKAAVRDVARVLDIKEWDIKPLLTEIDEMELKAKNTIPIVMEETQAGQQFAQKYTFASAIMMALEGQIRSTGQHAAAICISKDSLIDGSRCSLAKRNNVTVANWDKNDAEYMGLMKLDVLGLSALTVLNEARRLIKQNYDKDIVFKSIDLNDAEIYDLIHDGFTAGVFQIGGSNALTKYCKELHIRDFETIVHATSLWRPGPLRAGMHIEFKERKVDSKKYKHINKRMETITAETYGVILYQEQVMLVMNQLAGMSWGECDKVRKVISKSKGDAEFNKFKKTFISGCVNNDIKEAEAKHIWDEICRFGNYSFNRAHAVEYSMITSWDLWLKAYYPAEFFAASLTYGADGKKDYIIQEANDLAITVHLPRVGASDAYKWICKDNELYAPFIEIKGVGEKTAEKFADQKAKPAPVQRGFFKSTGSEQTGKSNKILDKIRRFEEKGEDEQEVQDLFSFKLPNNLIPF